MDASKSMIQAITAVESTAHRLSPTVEIISGRRHGQNILHLNINKEKNKHYQNVQESWEMIKNLQSRRRS